MRSQTQSSNRTKQNFRKYEHGDPDIFNHSFYEEKLGASEGYQTVQFVKKYFKETNLTAIVEKVMGTLLHMQKLPLNPYNLMYRLVHHQAIYQNLRRHYHLQTEQGNFINSNMPESEDYQNNSNQNQQLFISMRLKDKEVFLSERLSKYVNMTNLFVFGKMAYHKKVQERFKGAIQKFNLDSLEVSIGGAILLDLRGNGGVLEVPVKLPRQAADKSIYCSESMLTKTVYVEMTRQFSKGFGQFVDFILDDIRETMHYKDEHHTVYFQKLQVSNIDEAFSLLQFSREQIISSGTFVQKELNRNLQRQNVIIRSKSVFRLAKELIPVVGEQFVTVITEYMLVAEEKGLKALVSNEPLRFVFKQIFFSDKIIEMVIEGPDYQEKDLMLEYKKEMVYHVLAELKMQNISELVWQIFYYLIYQSRDSSDNNDFVNQMFQTISYVLLSPIGFVYQLQHALKSVKWLTLPSFPTYSQNEAYLIIIGIQKEITAFIQKGDYIYWELELFYEAIKMLLSIIVEFKSLKLSAINFIVDHALLMLSGVSTNFNQIILVLQGNITSYISVIYQLEDNSKRDHEKIITYDQFLKQKQLPTSVLRVGEEVKKIKKQLSMQESQVKSILLGKYVARYQLYEKLYSYFWQIAIGKKVLFPLSGYLKLLMINSTQCGYERFRQNYTKPKFKVESNVVNGLRIYQINNVEAGVSFCSLHPDSLQFQAIKEYKTIVELIEPFVMSGGMSESSLGYRYGSKNSVESSSLKNTASSSATRSILSVKSIDMGDNGAEQSSTFSVCKILIDVIIGRNITSKNDLYSFALDQLNSMMSNLDNQLFSVLGLFSYNQNHYQTLAYDDYLYSRILSENNSLRFDYKKKLGLAQFAKFIDYNTNQGRFMEARVIYVVREVTKVLKIGFNFHYKNGQNYQSLFKMHYANQRVFPSKKDLLSWCEVYRYNPVKETPRNQRNSKEELLVSVKKLQEEKEVSITDVLADKDLESVKEKKQAEKHINKFKFYRQSPFYNILRKVSQILQVKLAVIQCLKTDRRGRFQLSHLQHLYELLKYYLLERCIVKDDYIYSEGISVSMANLLVLVRDYFQNHPDNCGEERELLQFQKVIRKLWGLVKFAEISCTICIHQSLNRTMTHDPSQL